MLKTTRKATFDWPGAGAPATLRIARAGASVFTGMIYFLKNDGTPLTRAELLSYIPSFEIKINQSVFSKIYMKDYLAMLEHLGGPNVSYNTATGVLLYHFSEPWLNDIARKQGVAWTIDPRLNVVELEFQTSSQATDLAKPTYYSNQLDTVFNQSQAPVGIGAVTKWWNQHWAQQHDGEESLVNLKWSGRVQQIMFRRADGTSAFNSIRSLKIIKAGVEIDFIVPERENLLQRFRNSSPNLTVSTTNCIINFVKEGRPDIESRVLATEQGTLDLVLDAVAGDYILTTLSLDVPDSERG